MALLNAGQEEPATDSNAMGVAYLTLDTSTGELCSDITFNGLTGTAIAAHYHGPALPGENAGILLDLTADLPSPISSCATGLSAQLLQYLNAGLIYLNVHTGTFPGGEIRGQVERVGATAPARPGGRLPILR